MKYLNKKYASIKDLKKHYRELANILHPDHGGSTEEMQILNNELEYILSHGMFGKEADDFTKAKNSKKNQNNRNYHYSKDAVIPDELVKIIKEIITFDVTIEIIGCWLWITGNTYPYRAEFKRLKLWYSKAKKAWYYPLTDSRSPKHYSLNQLREMHGSQVIQNKHYNALEV